MELTVVRLFSGVVCVYVSWCLEVVKGCLERQQKYQPPAFIFKETGGMNHFTLSRAMRTLSVKHLMSQLPSSIVMEDFHESCVNNVLTGCGILHMAHAMKLSIFITTSCAQACLLKDIV